MNAEQAAELKVGDVVTFRDELRQPHWDSFGVLPGEIDVISDHHGINEDQAEIDGVIFLLRHLRLATPAEIQQAHKGGAEG